MRIDGGECLAGCSFMAGLFGRRSRGAGPLARTWLIVFSVAAMSAYLWATSAASGQSRTAAPLGERRQTPCGRGVDREDRRHRRLSDRPRHRHGPQHRHRSEPRRRPADERRVPRRPTRRKGDLLAESTRALPGAARAGRGSDGERPKRRSRTPSSISSATRSCASRTRSRSSSSTRRSRPSTRSRAR